MKSKLQRKTDGPGWIEVIFGAALSLVLGVVLAAVYLVFKPTTPVKELPKEPVAHMVYYMEGTRDSSKMRELASKRRQFAQGATVAFNEDELNTMVMPQAPAGGAKKMELPQPAPVKETFSASTPNFRIRNDVMQVGLPVTLNVYETDFNVVIQARGNFDKVGEEVVFQPSELLVGSCPIEKLPAVRDYVIKQLIARVKVPDELAASWRNVTDATVKGSTLQLTSKPATAVN